MMNLFDELLMMAAQDERDRIIAKTRWLRVWHALACGQAAKAAGARAPQDGALRERFREAAQAQAARHGFAV